MCVSLETTMARSDPESRVMESSIAISFRSSRLRTLQSARGFLGSHKSRSR